ncbi:hypothetical protein NQZ68_031323, partial [Dissostichus eleginoides]
MLNVTQNFKVGSMTCRVENNRGSEEEVSVTQQRGKALLTAKMTKVRQAVNVTLS